MRVIRQIRDQGCDSCQQADFSAIDDHYLGGEARVESLWQAVQGLKRENHFFALYMDSDDQAHLENLAKRLERHNRGRRTDTGRSHGPNSAAIRGINDRPELRR